MLDALSVERLSAHWSLLFEVNGPTCTRIRPIVSSRHPLRRGRFRNAMFIAETRELGRLLSGHDPMIPHRIQRLEDQLRRYPGLTTLKIAARLLNRGIHERSLQRYEHGIARLFANRNGEWVFLQRDVAIGIHFDQKRQQFEPVPTVRRQFVCYFGCPYQVSISTERAALIGVTVCSLGSVPLALQEHILEIATKYENVSSYLDQKEYVRVGCEGLDPASAVEDAVARLERLRDETVIGVARPPDPYRDLHQQIAMETPDGPYTFNWKKQRRAYKSLPSFVDPAVVRAALDDGGDLARLIACLSRAQAAFDTASDTDIFYDLVRAQDLLFRDYYSHTCSFQQRGSTPASDFFIDIAARFLAINAPSEIYESLWTESWSPCQKLLRSGQTHRLDAASLVDFFSENLPLDAPWPNGEPRFSRSRILARAGYLSRIASTDDQWKWDFRKHYIRAALDLNHVRFIRNALVHDSDFVGSGYYITLMINLLRDVVVFRLACFAAYDRLDARERGIVGAAARQIRMTRPRDAIFVLAMHGLLLDGEWSLGRGGSVWLRRDRIVRVHLSGWGGWRTERFGANLVEKVRLIGDPTSYSWTPLAAVADLQTAEII